MKQMKLIISTILCSLALISLATFQGCAEWRSAKTIGENIDDTNIVAKIKANLLAEPNMPSKNITVNSQKGVVQLSGFVNSLSNAEKASQIAYSIKGVHNVINHLEVTP